MYTESASLHLTLNSDVITTAYAVNNVNSGATSAVVSLGKGDKVKVVTSPESRSSLYESRDVWQGNVFDGFMIRSDHCLG